MGVRQEGVSFVDDNIPKILALDYDVAGNLIYLGIAAKGSAKANPNWKINKLFYDGAGNLTDFLESPNYAIYGDIWNDRTSLSYS